MKADKKAKEKAEKEAKQPQPAKTENGFAKQKDDEEIDPNVSYCLLYLKLQKAIILNITIRHR